MPRPAALKSAALAPALLAALLAAPLVTAPAAAQTAAASLAGAESAQTTRLRAQVLTVDREGNQILLRDLADGELFVHEPVSPMTGMMNVQSGDIVLAFFTRGVTVRPAEAGDPDRTEVDAVAIPARTAAGDAMMAGALVRSVVTLTRWDAETSTAYGLTPEGEPVSHRVLTDEGRAFLATQSPGARLEVEISETVVIERE